MPIDRYNDAPVERKDFCSNPNPNPLKLSPSEDCPREGSFTLPVGDAVLSC